MLRRGKCETPPERTGMGWIKCTWTLIHCSELLGREFCLMHRRSFTLDRPLVPDALFTQAFLCPASARQKKKCTKNRNIVWRGIAAGCFKTIVRNRKMARCDVYYVNARTCLAFCIYFFGCSFNWLSLSFPPSSHDILHFFLPLPQTHCNISLIAHSVDSFHSTLYKFTFLCFPSNT